MHHDNSQAKRTAFTLLELMVVLAIIMLLVGLFLPLLQLYRMRSAQLESINNLKQIVLALHSAHDAHRCLPHRR